MKITYNQESTNQSIELELKQFTLFSGESKGDVVYTLLKSEQFDFLDKWDNSDLDNLLVKFNVSDTIQFSENFMFNTDKKLLVADCAIDRLVLSQCELDNLFDKLFDYCIKEDIYVIFTISNPLSVISLYNAVLKHKLFENDLYTEIEVWNHSKTNNLGYSDYYYNDYRETSESRLALFNYNTTHYIYRLKEQLKHFLNHTLYGDDRECTDRLYDRFI